MYAVGITKVLGVTPHDLDVVKMKTRCTDW